MAGAVTVATSDPSTTGGVVSETVTTTGRFPVFPSASVASTVKLYSPTTAAWLKVTTPSVEMSKYAA